MFERIISQKFRFSNETESNSSSVSKAEREQELQKYYRAELIQHLTDWPVTQLEKQVKTNSNLPTPTDVFI